MARIATLTTGCMESILSGVDIDKPVVQILGSKKIPGPEGTDRLRLLVSDGKHLNSFAMLATQLNDLHAKGELDENTIVRLDRYCTSMVNKSEKGERRVLVILELTVLNHGSQVGKKIGTPVPYTGEPQKPASNVSKPAPSAATPSSNTSNGSAFGSRPTAASPYGASNGSSFGRNAAPSTQGGQQLTHPIASLSPYQNRWVIKARVTAKSGMRSWSNAKGEGKLFSMDLMDESGEIRATAFRDAADKFYDLIEVDKVYYISKCQLKSANKQFSTLNNDYEMTFTNETTVQPCDDDESCIPKMQFNFVPIAQIANIEPKAAVDVIGVCKETGEIQRFTGRTNNKEFIKREITLVDSSNASVALTLWGDDAVNFDGHVQPVILVKGARVSEFGGGKTINLGVGSSMKINPDIPEGHKLRGWFDNGGGDEIQSNVSTRSAAGGGSFNTEWLTFHEAQLKNLGADDKPDYFQVKAVIHMVKATNATYKACPQPDCNKKVIDEENGMYRCEKCNQSYTNFKYRLLINMSVADWTSNRWVTCFNEIGEQLLGKSAQEVGRDIEEQGEAALQTMNFKSYVFKLRAKMEMFGDVGRNKMTVMNISPVNYKEYNRHLIKDLQELTGIGKV